MSRHATDWAWETDPGSSSLKLILLSMADRADEYNLCYGKPVRVRRLAIFAVQTVTTIAPLQQAKQALCALRIQKAHHGMAGADPVMMILALSGNICTVVLALPVSLLQMELLQLPR